MNLSEEYALTVALLFSLADTHKTKTGSHNQVLRMAEDHLTSRSCGFKFHLTLVE